MQVIGSICTQMPNYYTKLTVYKLLDQLPTKFLHRR
jgi:hypothetical protein